MATPSTPLPLWARCVLRGAVTFGWLTLGAAYGRYARHAGWSPVPFFTGLAVYAVLTVWVLPRLGRKLIEGR